MTSKTLAVAASLIASNFIIMAPTVVNASPPSTKDVTAVLFKSNYDSVARECARTLGTAGYGYVQVSPPAEHIQGSQWWTSYQPVSYKLAGRLGDRGFFLNMVKTCHSAGVRVIIDIVINQMTAGSGTGTGGSSYTKYNYPGLYSFYDFDDCTSQITNYVDRWNVQHCELVGLADLDTNEDYVRGAIAGYMNDLLSLGVDGFRIDAAKHTATEDLANMKSRLANSSVYWKQEVIYGAGEAVQPTEYTGNGDVQEFRYAFDLKPVFNNEKLAYLRNYGEGWGYMSSSVAGVFVDNHDTERNGETLRYKDNAKYTLATVFMLAYPYGAPDIKSGYEFSDTDAGPPYDGAVNACCQDSWKCQHAWPEIMRMVAFRNVVRGQGVTNWWDNGNNQIAFGWGNQGFVAINKEDSLLTQTLQTSLPAGKYCNVQSNSAVTVNSSGHFTATLGPNTALAIYAGKSSC
ncbi:alpha-amylase-domain-containing protein [Paraphaeosphaeria sporulosa]|uniref:Alpha-amylase n=1 Tax=Paraphaeosphaeria sporulosa TaxID=1460663 RepID=A0A177CAS9_9PLEO|nr:alpha-amylase-domain-containing protein [Paraphaeosphaeria sporulosa]OAG04271.1 alpha-amylase-domain-containing protein [Paraphaeosphaeria sporulosa]